MQCHDTLILFGDGVSVEKLTQVSDCFSDAELRPSTQSVLALIVIANVDDQRLARAFERPSKGCFEVVEQTEIPKDIFVKSFSTDDFSFSFSSKTVYRLPVAHCITNALFTHFDLKPSLRDNVEMALHEALVNAVVHGNLELGHIRKDSLDSLQSFDEEAEVRLSDPEFSLRKIDVSIECLKTTIEIKVVDQGEGFSIDHDAWHDLPWRGINLISTLTSSVRAGESGEPLTMIFDR
ncbi:MAG: ATP-binding protein [Magnetovibrio sp.]|nr:ATP-binding protein [Magnetovibrio sp.]